MSKEGIQNFMVQTGTAQRVQQRIAEIACTSDDIEAKSLPINELAKRIHPGEQKLKIISVMELNNAKTFRLASKDGSPVAYFIPGQYLPLYVEIEENLIERPYSISSSPAESLKGYYEITVRPSQGGYVSNYICNNWSEETEITTGGPQGFFYHTTLRDRRDIVAIAGGSGITPFRAMAKSIEDKVLDVDTMTLVYGCNKLEDALFVDEFREIERRTSGRFKMVLVLADENADGCERGFITTKILKKYADTDNVTFFICGPQGLYSHIAKELAALNLRRKFVRYELFGERKNAQAMPEFPEAAKEKTFNLTVHMQGEARSIPAISSESVLSALERGGMKPPAHCRSGACGFCRSYIVSGDVFIPEEDDQRRLKDQEIGHIHPCCSFPVSDLEIIVPRA